MKINPSTHFPHPILSEDTGDFISGEFKVEFEVTEDTVTNQLVLKAVVDLDSENISNLLSNKLASVGLHIQCAGTYYFRTKELSLGDNTIAFKPGVLAGRVSIRPFVWSTSNLSDYSSSNFHDEYEGLEYDIKVGQPLAWDDERIIDVGQKKLASMESIFEISVRDDLEPGVIGLDPENSKITIFTSRNTYEHINLMRNNAQGRAVLLNGVYLPAIMQLLCYLDDGVFEKFEWYDVFKAKCDFYNIGEDDDPLESAQKLLKNPYLRISETFNE